MPLFFFLFSHLFAAAGCEISSGGHQNDWTNSDGHLSATVYVCRCCGAAFQGNPSVHLQLNSVNPIFHLDFSIEFNFN